MGVVLLTLNLRVAVGEIPPVLRDLPLSDLGRSLLVTIAVLCFSLGAFAGPPLAARLGEERGLLIAWRAHDAVIAARLSGMAQGIGYMISALGPLAAGLVHAASGAWSMPILMSIGSLAAQLSAGVGAARRGVIAR